jgi:hypothetical protein
MGGGGVCGGGVRWVRSVFASGRTQQVPAAPGVTAARDGETACTPRGRNHRPTARKRLYGCLEPMAIADTRVVVACGEWWAPACEKTPTHTTKPAACLQPLGIDAERTTIEENVFPSTATSPRTHPHTGTLGGGPLSALHGLWRRRCWGM